MPSPQGKEVAFSPSQIREAARKYEARGLDATTSALSHLSQTKNFSLPPLFRELQTSIESLLATLNDAPLLMEEMTKSFTERAEESARLYETTENQNASLADSVNRKKK